MTQRAALNVLIIDDNSSKAREVARGLAEIDGYDASRIEVVPTANDAKRVLKTTQYDLVVLDIALPLRADQEPDRFGGLKLLEEVFDRPNFLRPKHIVGLTAHEDIYIDAAARLGNELWSVVKYDATSEAWLERIKAKARHIWAAEQQSVAGTFNPIADICLITALQDPELDAILALPWAWDTYPVAGDSTLYHRARYTTADGTERVVIAARAPGMGMPAAAILTTKMAMQFRPRCIVMPGICAGNVDDVALGDVIIANPSWDYGSGKHSVSDSGDKRFAAGPQQSILPTRVRGLIERVQIDRGLLDGIRNSYTGQKPSTALNVHLGPLASGAAVLADQGRFDEVKAQHRKLLGVDMEAYAVMSAAEEMLSPQPEALVLKGVSDFANSKKDDRYRHYAAYTSARLFAHLAERLLL